MKELMMTQGRVTPPRDSQDSAESDDYRDAVRLNVEPGDLMPSRMQQTSVGATTLTHNAVYPAITTPPIPAAVPKLSPPTAPSAPSASSPPLASSNLAFASPPGPSAVTLPSRAMSKTPPIPKLPVPDDKPLPNPYAVRDSRMESVILATPADDHFLHNPYPDSMDGHSPARADSPEPFGSIGPVQPLRVAKKNSAGSYARSSTLDKGSSSHNSDLYNLPVLDISSASLALSTSSKSSESSSQNISRAHGR